MRQCLVIGSTVVDVLITLPHLPVRGEDININTPLYRMGGCAYNVYQTLHVLESPALLCSPVGTGIYGRMVRKSLAAQGIKPLVNLDEENGCCYCLIEADGERTFLSCRGAEYRFSRSWMKAVDFSRADSVFVCGIEIEDPTGSEIIDFVKEHPELELYFAPGPRITHIEKERMEALLGRRDTEGKGPVLHLNEHEALAFSGKASIEAAAGFLAGKTGNALVITRGEKGCYGYEPAACPPGRFVPGFSVDAVDTTGAGDAHCGAVIAGLKMGKSLYEACEAANRIGAAAAGIHGAIPDKAFLANETEPQN